MTQKNKRSKYFLAKVACQLVKSWWVFGFFVFVYILGLKSFKAKETLMLGLQRQVAFLTEQKDSAFKKKINLQQQIASQQDSAFVEMILMKKLGVVPEGHVKICFKKSSQDSLLFYEEL